MRRLVPSRCGFRRSTRLCVVLLVLVACLSVMLVLQRIDPSTLYLMQAREGHAKNLVETAEALFSHAPKEKIVTEANILADKNINNSVNSKAEKNSVVSIRFNVYPPPVTPRSVPTNGTVYQVTTQVTGQLGNRMFQYAAVLGVAYLNGMMPTYKTKSKLGHIFHVTHISDAREPTPQKVVGEKNYATYDPKFERLPNNTHVKIMQYFQSWKYFDFIRDEIKREFTFQQPVKDRAAKLLAKFSKEISGRTKIGVHIRRGDMLMAHHVRRGYHTATASYVRQSMELMRQKHGDVIFIIVTQDRNWCQREITTSDHVFVDNAPGEVHLALLASCDHVIMTVGTYGWWGGYLAGGDVVYYWDHKVCLHNPPLEVELRNPQDFYLPHWTPLAG